ncbi:MAG: ribosomal protein S18-alanine N-acetyltransferase [Thaumarchaeota archaeon]|nr:ribosomal protein S18-alanine N-acetyltransferase [Nitrososphaerota archaeon]
MFIRPFKEQDLSEILAIERASFTHPYGEEVFNHLWNRHPEGFAVACEEDKIVGYTLFGVDDDGDGVLYSISVHPSARHRGYGAMLLEYSLKQLAKKVKRVYLQVAVDNLAAIQLYLKRGFTKKKTCREYYEDGRDAYLLVKQLR